MKPLTLALTFYVLSALNILFFIEKPTRWGNLIAAFAAAMYASYNLAEHRNNQ